jgi:hypothetical protein
VYYDISILFAITEVADKMDRTKVLTVNAGLIYLIEMSSYGLLQYCK